MPPRRATRKQSVELANAIEREPKARNVSASKRKRADLETEHQTEPIDLYVDEEDDSEGDTKLRNTSVRARKPASKQKASGSASGKGRTRRAASVALVEEEEESEAPSPPKRSKRNTPQSDDDSGDDFEEKSAPKGRKGSTKPASRATTRTSRVSKKVEAQVDSEAEDVIAASSDEQVKPKRLGKTSSKPSSRASSVGRTSKSTKGASRVEVKVEPIIEESEGEDEDLLQSLAASRTSKPSRASSKGIPTVNEGIEKESDDESEQSLLENLQPSATARPRPSIIPPPIVEEPKGPRARLVIHKLVLVNFKSYAGRQVIGPFHKVRLSSLRRFSLIPLPVIFSDCWAKWFWKIKHD